jgi:hypothetical protein
MLIDHPETRQVIDNARHNVVGNYLDSQREALRAPVTPEKRAAEALASVEERSKPSEEVKRVFEQPEGPTEAHVAALEKDAGDLEKTLLDTAPTPEERAQLQADLRELQEDDYVSEEKALSEGVPCATMAAMKGEA